MSLGLGQGIGLDVSVRVKGDGPDVGDRASRRDAEDAVVRRDPDAAFFIPAHAVGPFRGGLERPDLAGDRIDLEDVLVAGHRPDPSLPSLDDARHIVGGEPVLLGVPGDDRTVPAELEQTFEGRGPERGPVRDQVVYPVVGAGDAQRHQGARMRVVAECAAVGCDVEAPAFGILDDLPDLVAGDMIGGSGDGIMPDCAGGVLQEDAVGAAGPDLPAAVAQQGGELAVARLLEAFDRTDGRRLPQVLQAVFGAEPEVSGPVLQAGPGHAFEHLLHGERGGVAAEEPVVGADHQESVAVAAERLDDGQGNGCEDVAGGLVDMQQLRRGADPEGVPVIQEAGGQMQVQVWEPGRVQAALRPVDPDAVVLARIQVLPVGGEGDEIPVGDAAGRFGTGVVAVQAAVRSHVDETADGLQVPDQRAVERQGAAERTRCGREGVQSAVRPEQQAVLPEQQFVDLDMPVRTGVEEQVISVETVEVPFCAEPDHPVLLLGDAPDREHRGLVVKIAEPQRPGGRQCGRQQDRQADRE